MREVRVLRAVNAKKHHEHSYHTYRDHMHGLYGPGPWVPGRVAECDRWRNWTQREVAR